MRIAFYAPLKSPAHGTPSGDRRIAGLLMDALARAGHSVELASSFRSYDPAGDGPRQIALRDDGIALGRRLAAQWRDGAAEARPELWFTYHLYYKAPDWLGPEASAPARRRTRACRRGASSPRPRSRERTDRGRASG